MVRKIKQSPQLRRNSGDAFKRREKNLRRLTAATIAIGTIVPSPVTAAMAGIVAAKGAGLVMDQRAAKMKAEQARVLRRLAAPEVETQDQRMQRRLRGIYRKGKRPNLQKHKGIV